MSPFGSTLRSLEREDVGGKGLLLLLITALCAVFSAWLVLGSVTVYAVSAEGRVEVDRTAHPVEPPVAGVVAENDLILGREVRAGDPLIVLDSTGERIRCEQEKRRLDTNEVLIAALEREITAERSGTKLQALSAGATQQAVQARAANARVLADLATKQYAITKSLGNEQLASQSELLRSSGEMAGQQAAADSARFEVQRVSIEQRSNSLDRTLRVIRLERERATIEGQISVAQTNIAALEWDIARRTIRAVVDGTIADVNPTPPGSTVIAGQKIASVVPPGSHRIVASYLPAEAVGRIRPGQAAIVRLDGFPWAQYGTHHASVVRVASEPRDNSVRVELVVDRPNPKLPVTHGLTGRVEIEVEQVSPWTMLLRSLGALLAPPAAPASAPIASR